jgi:hypothetical protein
VKLRIVITLVLAALSRSQAASPASQPLQIEPIVTPYWGERVATFRMDEGLRVQMNWPANFEASSAPVRLIFFTLPNGNTIEHTVGCKAKEGLHWRYNIQYIGAQVRRLREISPDERIVIAYMEADCLTWPLWKKNHAKYRELIPTIINKIREAVGAPCKSISLLSHSGGGSFLFGYIDSFKQIPPDVERIAFLDSNYGYDDEVHHGDKLIAWLKADDRHVLTVACYDDGHALLEGKFFLSAADKGTWGSTGRMLYRFIKDIPLASSNQGPIQFMRGLDGRCEFILHTNPENKILHTILVGDMSGFLHAMTLASPLEKTAGPFAGPVSYEKWIQPEPLVPTVLPKECWPKKVTQPATNTAR